MVSLQALSDPVSVFVSHFSLSSCHFDRMRSTRLDFRHWSRSENLNIANVASSHFEDVRNIHGALASRAVDLEKLLPVHLYDTTRYSRTSWISFSRVLECKHEFSPDKISWNARTEVRSVEELGRSWKSSLLKTFTLESLSRVMRKIVIAVSPDF